MDNWTLADVQNILPGIRYVHNFSVENFTDSKVIEMFGEHELEDLHHITFVGERNTNVP